MRNPLINNAIALSLSRERLDKYLNAAGNDLDLAIGIYERNTRLAEAFYTPLQALEICLRNRIDRELSQAYGADWMRNGIAPLNAFAAGAIRDAISDLSKAKVAPSTGAIVAELHFGFWLSLLAKQYDSTIWRGACYRAFSENGRYMARQRVHGRLNAIRRFRNRIAHHEPIFHADLQLAHDEILGATEWMCPETAAWARYHSRFPAVFAAP